VARLRTLKIRALAVLALVTVGTVVLSGIADAQQPTGPVGAPEPPMLGVHWARDANPGQAHKPGSRVAKSPNLSYHGGPVMNAGTVVVPIYWGTSWAPSGDPKITGMSTFYGGVGTTAYLSTNSEYTDSTGNVSTGVTTGTPAIDTSAAPRRAPRTSAVLAEVAKMVPNPVANGYYPVYVDAKRGSAGYCGWHSWGSINGTPVQFGFIFNLDGDSGCDPQDPNASAGAAEGLAAIANVSAHELSEVLTDPRGSAWYDSTGYENADKCAWTFSDNRVDIGDLSLKIQGNWSNNAYNGNQGYVDTRTGSKVRGCIDGS
jgi:hypothetical protein